MKLTRSSLLYTHRTGNNYETGDETSESSGEKVNLVIVIKECRNVLIGDTTTSDPYVKILFGGKVVHKTKHILKTLNPIFTEEHNNTFRMTVAKQDLFDNRGLVFKLMDWDRFSTDDNLGASRLLPQPLYDAKGEDIEIKLFPPPNRKEEDAGFLTISCKNETIAATTTKGDMSGYALNEISRHHAPVPTSSLSQGLANSAAKNGQLRRHESEGTNEPHATSNLEGGDRSVPHENSEDIHHKPYTRLTVYSDLGDIEEESQLHNDVNQIQHETASLDSDEEDEPETMNINRQKDLKEVRQEVAWSVGERTSPLLPSRNTTRPSGRELLHQRLEEGLISSSLPSVEEAKLDLYGRTRGNGMAPGILNDIANWLQCPRIWFLLIGVTALLALIIGLAGSISNSRGDSTVTGPKYNPEMGYLGSGDGSSGTDHHVHGGMVLRSDAFDDGDKIPTRFTADGENISPMLYWSGAPPGTKSFLLICESPRGGDHWVVYNIPHWLEHFEEGMKRSSHIDISEAGSQAYFLQGVSSLAGAREVDFVIGYHGPDPPGSSGSHTYVFSLYALDGILENVDPRFATSKAVTHAVLSQGHTVLGTGTLTGTYEKP